MNYYYQLDLDLEIPKSFPLLTDSLKDLISEDENNFLNVSTILVISSLAQTNFNSVDKEFQKFGKFHLILTRKLLRRIEYDDLILDSFSKLILNNIGFANAELFPEVDIQMIESKLQVKLLLNGMYFRLLPNILIKRSNMTFHFK
jgi:hypothetical protein